MTPVILVKQLSKEYEYYKKEQGMKGSFQNFFHREKLVKQAVSSIDFAIEEGEIVGFLGPNGAGKTTTLKMLSGILYPTSGEASVLGHTPWNRESDYKRQISIVMGQKNQLWWDLPASESMHLNQCIYEIDDHTYQNRLHEMAEILDVKELLDIQVRRLSLGERMKMELIAALLHHPKVLFLDEPTIGLDIISQKKIREFLKYYNAQEETTILLTSHYMADITDLCRRSIVIAKGTLVYDNDTAKIHDLLGNKKLLKLKLETETDLAYCHSLAPVVETDGLQATLEVDRHSVQEITARIFQHLHVTDFTVEDLPIEDSISILYHKEQAAR